MTSYVLDMIKFLLSGQLPVQSFLINFLVHLLKIGLFKCYLHISKSFLFLLFKLLSILIYLNRLLIKSLFLSQLHFISPLPLLLLLSPPDVRLNLLQPLTIPTRFITQIVLKSYPANIFKLLGPRI